MNRTPVFAALLLGLLPVTLLVLFLGAVLVKIGDQDPLLALLIIGSVAVGVVAAINPVVKKGA